MKKLICLVTGKCPPSIIRKKTLYSDIYNLAEGNKKVVVGYLIISECARCSKKNVKFEFENTNLKELGA